jgi:drug/metabolite transporter (DMT)-like permease
MKANKRQNKNYSLFTCARLISAGLLIWAFGRHRYIFYQLVKLIVVGVTVYGAFYAHTLKAKTWMVIFIVIAILFNPFVPVHLNRHTWEVFDLAGAGILLLSVFLLKSATKDSKEG